MQPVRVGVFGGSGLYDLLADVEHVEVDTPYGPPSGPVAVGAVDRPEGPVGVAFLPRHGPHHELPPHRIDYRANVWALASLGVERILAPCASGSLQPGVRPGDLVVLDQLVDRTSGRVATYFDGPTVNHVSLADPYCEQTRQVLLACARATDRVVHPAGTVVVVEGPRFSTRAESRWFRDAGWHAINMTQYPEVALARELGLCYAAIAIITDYDAGVDELPDVGPVTQDEVYATFAANLPIVRGVLQDAIRALPVERSCGCAAATNGLRPDPPR